MQLRSYYTVTPHIIQHYLCTLSVTVMVMGDLKEGEERDRERGGGEERRRSDGMGRRGIRWKRKERGQRTEGRAEEEDDEERGRGLFQRTLVELTGFFNGLY